MIRQILCVLILASSLCGCTTWMRSYVAVHDAVDVVLSNKVDTVIASDGVPVASTTQTLWDAVIVNWMVHGEGTGENEIRAAAIQEAAASGKAIRFKFRVTGTDLRFWLLWWESNVDKGKFPQGDMATPAALRAGVTHWVVDAQGCDLALVVDTFKAYGDPDHMLQFVSPTPEMIKQIGLDSNGVKITPPKRRK